MIDVCAHVPSPAQPESERYLRASSGLTTNGAPACVRASCAGVTPDMWRYTGTRLGRISAPPDSNSMRWLVAVVSGSHDNSTMSSVRLCSTGRVVTAIVGLISSPSCGTRVRVVCVQISHVRRFFLHLILLFGDTYVVYVIGNNTG